MAIASGENEGQFREIQDRCNARQNNGSGWRAECEGLRTADRKTGTFTLRSGGWVWRGAWVPGSPLLVWLKSRSPYPCDLFAHEKSLPLVKQALAFSSSPASYTSQLSRTAIAVRERWQQYPFVCFSSDPLESPRSLASPCRNRRASTAARASSSSSRLPRPVRLPLRRKRTVASRRQR